MRRYFKYWPQVLFIGVLILVAVMTVGQTDRSPGQSMQDPLLTEQELYDREMENIRRAGEEADQIRREQQLRDERGESTFNEVPDDEYDIPCLDGNC